MVGQVAPSFCGIKMGFDSTPCRETKLADMKKVTMWTD
jgi:hypothetical protein